MDFLLKILSFLVPSNQGTSWIDLDKQMRKRVRLWGLTSILLLAVLILLSLYLVGFTPIQSFTIKIKTFLTQSSQPSGKMPEWIPYLATTIAIIPVLVAIFFLTLLIDFGNIHYTLDRKTFGVIQSVDLLMRSFTLQMLGCPDTSPCALVDLLNTVEGKRNFRDIVFYHFANQDMIGTHNQADKRRQVFDTWTQYYLVNQTMSFLLAAWLWFASFFVIVGPLWISIPTVCLLYPIIFRWRTFGHNFQVEAETNMRQQISAFFLHANAEVFTQAASLIPTCTNPRCNVRPSLLMRR